MIKKLILIGIAIVLTMGIAACEASKPDEDIIDNKNGEEEIIDKGENPPDKEDEDTDKEKIEYELTEEGIIKSEDAKKIIEETANKVIEAISKKDFEAVAKFVHPTKGVRFTPYTHVSLEDDVVFKSEKVNNFFEDEETYKWGYYDGIGNEILLTPSGYYEKFIYAEDFINPEEIGYNEVLSSGNMLENQFEVYESPIVVEYYFSGLNPEYEGIDWRSLRLVFEEYEGDWKLVGIINNQWTI